MKTSAVSTRRRFLWKAGAALSVPLAAAGAVQAAVAGSEDSGSLKVRLAELDDIDAIRGLQQSFAQRINAGLSDDVGELFSGSANPDAFSGLCNLAPSDFGEHDVIELAADGKTASTETHCTVVTETTIEADGTLAEMAHQQGDGVRQRTEMRVLEADLVKRRGHWKIQRLGFRNA